MRYDRIKKGRFLERPNRFIAHVEIEGQKEIVHVKNTGRCAELFVPGAVVYVQENDSPGRKTKWDLIGVEKGKKMINVDSQIPNYVAKEWIEEGGLFSDVLLVKQEVTYGSSRFDLYVEHGQKKTFIEVKGVTLEEEGRVRFPDAPSERAVKHIEELVKAVEEGYEAYILFVIQMKDVRYFTPNRDTHLKFAEALEAAAKAGVKVLAYDCQVTQDFIRLADPVPVALDCQGYLSERLFALADPLIAWYRGNKRDLPWRKTNENRQERAYHVWVSEIMLQQTRVEAVKPYYQRFLEALPTVEALAEAEEDRLLKLWEGLGYYNRVRNMQKAARQVMVDFHGEIPGSFEAIYSLAGIGSYTAGAIASFAFGVPKPAVDGNVLRVISRLLASYEDIMKASVRKKIEESLEKVIPADAPSDFNQGLIELGALICVPSGAPKCAICPVSHLCRARELGCQMELPVKKKEKVRKIQPRTILLFRDGGKVAIRKRPARGLLAGLYEFPGLEGHLTMEEVIAYSKKIGLSPIRVEPLPEAKHIFSHVEWQMKAYMIRVDELEKKCTEPLLFAPFEEIQKTWAIPSAFSAYIPYVSSWTKG